ncbi:hypothetical protein LUZ60_004774 [Juncus effusus]|nr:hypothetical protein LUZ60_004774 [Juncus effusus]
MAGKTMQAFCYEGYGGGASALKKVDKPIPAPKKGEILVKVEAVSLNAVDWKIQKGVMKPIAPKFPCVPVSDISGEVVTIGKGVENFKPGDKVVSLLNFMKGGGLAEYTVVLASQTAKLPPQVSSSEAAGLPIAAITALKSLQLLNIKFNNTDQNSKSNILITAASGGVGCYAVQLAKLANLHITATCGVRNVDLVKTLGAGEVLDYKTPEGESLKSPSGRKYDFVVNCTDGIIPWKVFEKNLSEKGRVVELAPSFWSILHSIGRKVLFMSKRLEPLFANGNGEDLEFLVGLVKEGKLKTVVDSKYSFDVESVREAWSRSMDGHATGKIIIEI